MVKRKPDPLNEQEMASLMNEIIMSQDRFDYVLFSLAKSTGRRLGELVGTPEFAVVGEKKIVNKRGKEVTRKILKPTGKYIGGLKVKDLDFDKGIMTVAILKRRNRESHQVPLIPELSRLLQTYIRELRYGLDDYVFQAKTYKCIQATIHRYALKALPNKAVSFHSFRHYFITYLFKKGWGYSDVRRLTGHQDMQTLSHYDHVLLDDIKDKALKALENI